MQVSFLINISNFIDAGIFFAGPSLTQGIPVLIDKTSALRSDIFRDPGFIHTPCQQAYDQE